MQQYIIIMKELIRAAYVATESYKTSPGLSDRLSLMFYLFIYSVAKNTTTERSSSLVLREIVPAA